MLSSCSLVGGSVEGAVVVVAMAGVAVVILLLLFVIRAGSWGAGALLTSLPSFSIFR